MLPNYTHTQKPKGELVHLCSYSSVLKILLSPVLWVKFIHFSKLQHKVERGSPTLLPLGEKWLCPLLCSLFWKYFPVSKGLGLLHMYPHLLLGCLLDQLGSKKLPSQTPLFQGSGSGQNASRCIWAVQVHVLSCFHLNFVKAILSSIVERGWP